MLCIQSYGIQYREESDVEIVTYVDFVDPIGHAHKAGLRSGTEHFSFCISSNFCYEFKQVRSFTILSKKMRFSRD